jgi:hypothetical protein
MLLVLGLGLGPAPSHACVAVCAAGWALGMGAEMGRSGVDACWLLLLGSSWRWLV